MLGELPNSFIKRRLNIAPGQTPEGGLRSVVWVADQIDSVVGATVATCFVSRLSFSMAFLIIALGLIIHPLGAFIMVKLSLKKRIG